MNRLCGRIYISGSWQFSLVASDKERFLNTTLDKEADFGAAPARLDQWPVTVRYFAWDYMVLIAPPAHCAAENDQLAAAVPDAIPRLPGPARQLIQSIVSRPEMPMETLEAAKAVLSRTAFSLAQRRAVQSILEI